LSAYVNQVKAVADLIIVSICQSSTSSRWP